jgi:uncharacterized membrane protein YfhO
MLRACKMSMELNIVKMRQNSINNKKNRIISTIFIIIIIIFQLISTSYNKHVEMDRLSMREHAQGGALERVIRKGRA